jgi:hypothetical protein
VKRFLTFVMSLSSFPAEVVDPQRIAVVSHFHFLTHFVAELLLSPQRLCPSCRSSMSQGRCTLCSCRNVDCDEVGQWVKEWSNGAIIRVDVEVTDQSAGSGLEECLKYSIADIVRQ